MVWEEELFAVLDDLEQQADAAYAAEREGEVADRSRAEYQRVTLASRLVASIGHLVTIECRGVGAVTGELVRLGDGWCLVRGQDQDWMVLLGAISAVEGASARSSPEVAWSPLLRLGPGSVLRRLAEAGERCVLHLVDGGRLDGVPGRIGADFVEVVLGEWGERTLLVPFAGLAAVQSHA